MLDFIKKNKLLKINALIVYNGSRFSRTGSTRIMDDLEDMGIYIHSAQTGISTETNTGRYMFRGELNNASFDNGSKSETTIDCTRRRLMEGRWVNMPPMGYDQNTTKKKQEITINETGKLLRKAFHWKADDGLTNNEILQRLKARGLKIYPQRLTDIFSNPFYCGLMRHKCLEGELVKGDYPALVSIETFKKVNNIISETHRNGYEQKRENDAVPLLGTIKCPCCGGNLTSYESTKMRNKYGKTGYYYYCCPRKDCRFNLRDKIAHAEFMNLLGGVSLPEKTKSAIALQLTKIVENYTKESRNAIADLRGRKTEIKRNIEEMEERWAMELEAKKQAILMRTIEKKEEELKLVEAEIKDSEFSILNPKEVINYAVKIYSNSLEMWNKSNLRNRQILQNTIFPEGIVYEKEKEVYRTCKINPLFDVMCEFSDSYDSGERKRIDNFHHQSSTVPRTGGVNFPL